MDRFDAEYCKQLDFIFSATRNTRNQRQSTKATCASQFCDIDLDAPPEQSMSLFAKPMAFTEVDEKDIN
jgi:hypothetical protein